MAFRFASINDLPIHESDRKYHWPLGRRPEDHPGLSDLGFWVVVLPGNTVHFHWARSGEYIAQVTAMGPLGIEYVNLEDDPRNKGGRI